MTAIEIPFAYEMEVMTATGNAVTRTYRETYSFEPKVVAAKDAPVVATLGRFEGSNGLGELGENVTIRKLGDVFIEPIRRKRHLPWNFNRAAGEPDSVIEAVAESGEGFAIEVFNKFRDMRQVTKADGVKLQGPPKPSTVLYDRDREGDRERIVLRAQGMYLIDGELYATVGEPVYKWTQDGVAVVQANAAPSHQIFRLDELDALVAAATFSVGKYGEAKPAPVLPEVQLHDASLLAWNDPKAAILAAATSLLSDVSEEMDRMPLDAMMAFADLRDLYSSRRSWEKGGPLTVDEVLPLAEALLREVKAWAPNAAFVLRFSASLELYESRLEKAREFSADMDAVGAAPGF